MQSRISIGRRLLTTFHRQCHWYRAWPLGHQSGAASNGCKWRRECGVECMSSLQYVFLQAIPGVEASPLPKMNSVPAACLIPNDETGSTDITDQEELAGLDAGTASSTTWEDDPEVACLHCQLSTDQRKFNVKMLAAATRLCYKEMRGILELPSAPAAEQVMRDLRPSGIANVHFRTKEASLRAIDALHMKELGGRYIEASCQLSRLKGREATDRRKMVYMIRPTRRDALSTTYLDEKFGAARTPSPPRFWKQEPDGAVLIAVTELHKPEAPAHRNVGITLVHRSFTKTHPPFSEP
ncbi:unnamed protein product [Symbiodinium sp. CCMP2592]|nr:unnamed protein product [Symbiodinium sp. CCMP2592]